MEFVQPIRNKETIEDMKKCFKNDRDRFLFVLGINTALRISDILKLRVRDLKGSHLKITESKTGKEKRQIITPALRKEIEQYIEGKHEEDFLFPSRKGNKPISRIQAYRVLNEVADVLGLDEIGTHTLRKTFGYHFYNQTKDIATLQQLLNHSAPSVTMRYIGLNQDALDMALEDFSL